MMRLWTRTAVLAGLLTVPIVAAAVPASADTSHDATAITIGRDGVSLAASHAAASQQQARYCDVRIQLDPDGLHVARTQSQAGPDQLAGSATGS